VIVGVAGRLGAGKDTVGDYLVRAYGFKRVAFADALKELCSHVVSRAAVGWNGENWTGSKSEYGRMILQGIGKGARGVIGPGVWVSALDRTLSQTDGLNPFSDRVVVTDVRYPNEVDYVRWNGDKSLLIRVDRPGVDRSGPEHQHETEAHVDSLKVDAVVVNDGTLEQLYARVDAVMARHSIGRLSA
jgi:hypothetical protein